MGLREAWEWSKSRFVALLSILMILVAGFFVAQQVPELYELFTLGSGPVVEYSVDFCSTNSGWTGGQNISCLYNATGSFAQFYSPWSNTCTECNVSFAFLTSNFTSGNVKFYYATNNGTLANERYYCENHNATHMKCSPEPGYDFSIGYIPFNTWVYGTIFLNYTSGNSTLFLYNATGGLYATISGTKVNKTFTVGSKNFAVDTGGRSGQFWLTNFSVTDTLGTGGSGSGSGRVDISGALNFSLISPLNGSSTNASSVNVSFQVWNLNTTASGAAGWSTTYDINMTTNPCTNGWTCGSGWNWDSASGKLFYNGTGGTGSLWGPNFGLSGYEAYNISVNISTPNSTLLKIHYMTDNGELDNCKMSLRRTNDTQHDIQRDCGSFSNTAAWTNGIEAFVEIFVNVTANTTIACRTAAGTTSCTSSAGAELTDLGDYLGFDDPNTMIGGGSVNITRVMVKAYTAGASPNTTVNVSVYNDSNVLLYQVNGTANGSIVSFNWTGLQLGTNGWYVTIKNPAGNVLNVTGLNVTRTAAAVGGNLSIVLVTPFGNTTVAKNQLFEFSVDVTCSNNDCANPDVYLDPLNIENNSFPVSRTQLFNGKTVPQWLDIYADAVWNDTVVCGFNTLQPMCLSIWYGTSTSNADSNMHACNFGTLPMGATCLKDRANKRFPFVTDENSNVLFLLSLASNQTRFELMLNGTLLMRHATPNNLQCWAGYVNGTQAYANYSTICATVDSASDASLRILWALDIACAKQRAGTWLNGTGGFGIDYCAEFVQQGKNIWGNGYTANHGEIKKLSSGRYFLCNGYNNQPSCPTNDQAMRPDYYELSGLLDWAEFMGNSTLTDGVIDMLEAYNSTMYGAGVLSNTSYIHFFKTGKFNSDGMTGYRCSDVGLPHNSTANCNTYNSEPQGTNQRNISGQDAIDTWRTEAAIGSVYANHPEDIYASLNDTLYVVMWNRYGGGNSSYGPTSCKPYEIRSDPTTTAPRVKTCTSGHRGVAMWLPMGVRFNASYSNQSVDYATGAGIWDSSNSQYYGEGFMDGYFSMFLPRAIATAAGLTAHNTYAVIGESSIGTPAPGTKNPGQLVSTTIGDTPFYTINSNPQQGTGVGCLTNMTAGTTCRITWLVNATGDDQTTYEFWVYANSDVSMNVNSSRINITIRNSDNQTPNPNTPFVSVSNQTANVSWTVDELTNFSFNYGTTLDLGTLLSNATLSAVHNVSLTGLDDGVLVYYNHTDCDFSGNCIEIGPLNFTTTDSTKPTVNLTSPANASNVTTSTISFLFNASDNIPGTLTCRLYLNTTGSWAQNASTTVTAGLIGQIDVSGFSSNVSIKWNVLCNDTTGNGAFAPQNYTTLFLSGPLSTNLSVCANISSFIFDPSLSSMNRTTGKLTQFNMTPRNHSLCACDIRLNNSGPTAQNVTLSTNITNTTTYRFKVNQSLLPKNYTVSAGAVSCLNVTMDYVNATSGVPSWKLTLGLA